MTADEKIRDVFSILHDGTIDGWSGDRKCLTLNVSCLYLAERIDKSFEYFVIKLFDISKVELSTWPNPFDRPAFLKSELNEIFEAELEILSAEIKSSVVVVTCNQHNPDFDYCGGHLSIKAESVQIYAQNWSELSLEFIDNLCNSYWNDFGRK